MRNYELHDAFQFIGVVNEERCLEWHGPAGLKDWSALEWAGAMCGEAGEVANVAKKIKRVETGMANKGGEDLATLNAKLAEELADTFLYLNLLARRQGIDLYVAVAEKFNRVSREYGFPQELPTFPPKS